MSILKKIKKNKHLLTEDEQDDLVKEAFLLQDEFINLSTKTPTKEVMCELLKKGKRLKQIIKLTKRNEKKKEGNKNVSKKVKH